MNYRIGFYLSVVGILVLGAVTLFGGGQREDNEALSSAAAFNGQTDALDNISKRLLMLDKKLAGFNRTLRRLEDNAKSPNESGAEIEVYGDLSEQRTSLADLTDLAGGRGPEGLVDSKAAAEERYTRLQNSFDEDVSGDSEQAMQLEQDIEQIFVDGDIGGLKLDAIECRSTQCKLGYETAGEFWDEEIEELEMSAALAAQLGGSARLRYGRQDGNKKTLYLDLSDNTVQGAEDFDIGGPR